MKNRILVVEDDAAIRDAVLLNLQFADYDAVAFDDGKKAADALESDHAYDLALLDIMLPGMDGFELFGLMEQYGIPVIYMTAKTDSASEIKGLRDGAEDYIVKPFEMLELLVRIEKILARTGKLNSILRYHDLTVDVEKRTVQKSGEQIKLQPLEFDLLVRFLKFKNCTLSRDRLLSEVWGFDFAGGTRTVDIHVAHLRKKLGPDFRIVSVMKYGYRLED
mgnify:CR=1 FL=1